ncbi:MAG TPA: gliding motility-associated C-terminal domain-containing protein, partial [Vicingus sp.]|nr:gliding motility-associated C-terminal domain-containing protein [Vicingus sp.]
MKLFYQHIITCCLLAFFTFSKITYGQNLVRNPSFEDLYSCPTTSLLDNHVKDWYGFNFARYFNSCSSAFGVPNNSYGYQIARTGSGYAHLHVYLIPYDTNRRSYIENHLIDTLKKNNLYCVTYYLNLCNNVAGAIKEIDAYLSTDSVYWNNGYRKVLKNITPQIKSNQMLNDSINWMLVSGLYKAKGGEQYITIGNFNTDENTTVLSFNPSGELIRSDYYIDDVSVTPFNLAPPNLGNDTILCANTPFTLTAPIGYDAYVWSNGNTSNTVNILDSGTYWVKCIANGCGEINDTIHIGYYNIPVLKLANDTTLCLGNTKTLAAQQGFNTYNWNTGETTQNITVADSGLYILEATSFCGIQTDSVYIKLDSLPTYSIFIGNDTTICHEGKNVSLTLFADTILPNYSWNTGAKTDSLVITSEGLYWLTTHYFCGNINSNTIAIEQCPKDSLINVYYPNSFTPNNDGINDVFMPFYTNIEPISFQVFNIWGNLVYQSQIDFFWDGTFNNTPCPTGLYVYRFTYKFR